MTPELIKLIQEAIGGIASITIMIAFLYFLYKIMRDD